MICFALGVDGITKESEEEVFMLESVTSLTGGGKELLRDHGCRTTYSL